MSVPDLHQPGKGVPDLGIRPKWTELMDTFLVYHQESVASLDYDPVVPVLARLVRDWPTDRQLWAILVYVTFDDLGSAVAVLDAHIDPAMPSPGLLADLPCSQMRRSHRAAGRLLRHFESIIDAADTWGGLETWMLRGVEGLRPDLMPHALATWVRKLHGNGPWAAHRTCELIAYVLTLAAQLRPDGNGAVQFLPVAPPEFLSSHAVEQRKALALLAPGLESALATATDVTTDATYQVIGQALSVHVGRRVGPPLPYTLGHTLSGFHALHSGRNYVGHAIDLQQQQLARVECGLSGAAWAARSAMIPAAYLGELCGRTGPDKDRRKVYQSTRRLVVRTMDGDATGVLRPMMGPC